MDAAKSKPKGGMDAANIASTWKTVPTGLFRRSHGRIFPAVLSALVVIVVLLVLVILLVLLALVVLLLVTVRHFNILLCRLFTAVP